MRCSCDRGIVHSRNSNSFAPCGAAKKFMSPVSVPLIARQFPWFVLKVRTRSEHIAVAALCHKGYDPFAPTFQERCRYSDRLKSVDAPVFPGYVFCRFDPHERVPVLNSPAVEYIVGFGDGPIPVPDDEIDAVRHAVSMGALPTEYLKVGQHVRIVHGALAGTEGILTRTSNGDHLVLSIHIIQRSVALHIAADLVEAL